MTDKMVIGFLECALWATPAMTSDSRDNGNLDDHIDIEDLSDATIKEAVEDCDGFRELAKDILESLGDYDEECLGHNFFLTRERHGAGFWDGRYPEDIGQQLTDIAHTFGGFDFQEQWEGFDNAS